MNRPRRPDFLVIGAARSSTTAVTWALGTRSDVFVTDPKETHFWAFAETPRVFTGPGDDEMFNRRLVADPEQYLALYAAADRTAICGDGSVSTLYHPDAAIPTIHRYASPDVRLVCVLREPAARALSAYRYLRARGYEDRPTFADGLAAESERVESGHHHMWHYRGMSRYSVQLPAFAEAFGERLFVAIAEEVKADPVSFSRQLLTFLDLPPEPALDLSQDVNRGGEPRSARVAAALSAARRNETVRRVVRSVVPVRTRERVRRANLGDGPPVDLSPLRAEFATEVTAVEDVLGRRIDAWHD